MDNPETLDTLHSKKHITETYKKKHTYNTENCRQGRIRPCVLAVDEQNCFETFYLSQKNA